MKDRILTLRDTLHLNQEEFGVKVGLSKASISALESGTRNITERHIKLICSEFNVNELWLRNGIGEMFVPDDEMSLDAFANQYRVTDVERKLFKALMKINPQERQLLVERCKQIFIEHEQAASIEMEISQKTKHYEKELREEKSIQTSLVSQTERDRGTA